MPRIDPFTGCPVMTIHEFAASEAKHEGLGRTGSEVLTEMFDDIAREEEAHAIRLSQPGPDGSYAEAIELINQYLVENDAGCKPGDPEWYGWAVTAVTAVRDAKVGFGRTNKEAFTADCLCSDGKPRTLRYQSWQSGGSGFEPPDGETTVEEV